MLQVYIGRATYAEDKTSDNITVGLTMMFLLTYVSYFTVLKFKRIRREEKEFEKLNQLTYE